MNSSEIRSRFLSFFEKRGHAVIPSASLVTPDEKGVTNSTLFNTAGMQPLVPYLLGKTHPQGVRLVDVQKCVRTVDIDDIGDKTHATFFEMLGNWSLGDYFKKEAINWSYEFLTDPKEGLGLDPRRLYVTVFEGDENAPKDDEAAAIWSDIFKKNGVEGERIFFRGAKTNWWEAGDNGPCGPDTEMFYDIKNEFGGRGITQEEYIKADDDRVVVEIWNDVFMQYEKKDGKIVGKLPKPSVDTGAGLERLAMTLQGVDNIYDTDLLKPVMDKIKELSKNWDVVSARIVADHVRAAVHLVADGVLPSNSDRGYVLRKLIRRAVRHSDILKMDPATSLIALVEVVQSIYGQIYSQTVRGGHQGLSVGSPIKDEEIKFRETLAHGIKILEQKIVHVSLPPIKIKEIPADIVFDLYQSYGFPIELTEEICKEKGITFNKDLVNELIKKHQDLSRAGAEQKFKGGLADAHDPMVVRYHTATHLLHQALHDVLGENEGDQKGSNITAERLRFDFTGVKLTDEQKKRVEDIVNEKIATALPMNNVVLPRAEAEKTGARHFFGEKYGDEISIYYIGDNLETAYSKEFCGGPHVKNTKELAGPEGKWKFKIQKEEASSQGVRRIKAVLE